MKGILLASLLFAQSASLAEETWITCRQIVDIALRVACYDDYVDTRLPMKSSDSAETSEPPELAESTTTPDAESLFGANDAEAKRIVEMSLAIEQIDNIIMTVTDVQESATRRLTVTLESGQVWQQLDDKRLHIKTGETVTIRKASLGSFLMEKNSGSRAIRVKRIN